MGVVPQLEAHLSMGMNTGLTEDKLKEVFDLTEKSVSREQARDNEGKLTGAQKLVVSRSIQLRTAEVMKARAAYSRQADLLRDGVELSGSNITFTFTGLNRLKPEMIAEAALCSARRK